MDNATLPPPPAVYDPPLSGRLEIRLSAHPGLSTDEVPYASSSLRKVQDGSIVHKVEAEGGIAIELRMTKPYVKDLIVRLQSFL